MAGCNAAAYAAQHGASVMLVEACDTIGGSAQYAGFVWTTPDLAVMNQINPDADEELSRMLVDDYDAALDWIASLGVSVGEPVTVLGYGRGCPVDLPGLLSACERAMSSSPRSSLITQGVVEELLVEEGTVRRPILRHRNGRVVRQAARHVLLATGGFSANPRLRAEYLHPQAETMALRSHEANDGGGCALGRSADAAFVGRGVSFLVS